MSPSGLEPTPQLGHPLLTLRCPCCGHRLQPPVAWPARGREAQQAEPGTLLNRRGSDRRLATTQILAADRSTEPRR